MTRTDVHDALTRLTRIAQEEGTGMRFLEGALSDRFERLVDAAFEVAVETGDPMGIALAQEAEQCSELETLEVLDP